VDPPATVEVGLIAEPGARTLPVVEVDADEQSTIATVRAYPVPRESRKLRLEVASGDHRQAVELPLD
jgi:hypothetical protein